jgi:soluble lytic murein transglycosylase-like protein
MHGYTPIRLLFPAQMWELPHSAPIFAPAGARLRHPSARANFVGRASFAASLTINSPSVCRVQVAVMKKNFSASLAVAALLALASASTLAHADCFDEAARYQKVNPLILRAIAWQESHNRPDAVHRNANGSIDYGVMQINSVHLPVLSQYGISSSTLMEPCKNVYIAAWHLRQKMNKYGNTWAAVGAYHSETPTLRDQYALAIADILRKWHLMQ